MVVFPHSRFWRVLGVRTPVSACPPVPAGQEPLAFRESSVLRRVGQQMALRGFELEPSHPKAALGQAGIRKPRYQELFEKSSGCHRPELQGPAPLWGAQHWFGERARSRVSWSRHQRVRDPIRNHDVEGAERRNQLCADRGACYFCRTQPKLGVQVRCPSSVSGFPKTHLLGISLRNIETSLSGEAKASICKNGVCPPPSEL